MTCIHRPLFPKIQRELSDTRLDELGSAHDRADNARALFNILISTIDDHLRNHGFLHEGAGGWCLSLAYDMNPTLVDVKARVLSLAIDEADDTASLVVALGIARQRGLKLHEAREIVGEVQAAVAHWRTRAVSHGLNARDVERMASAFEHGTA